MQWIRTSAIIASMTLDVDAFLDRWVYDLERILLRKLDALKDDLDCGDKRIKEKAAEEAAEILDLLYGALKPKSREERQRSIEQELESFGVPATRARSLARRDSRSTGRAVGRPREMGLNAIRALTLRLTTDKSWREIALEVNGCNHVCSACGRPKSEVFEGGPSRRPRPRCPQCGLTVLPKPKVKLSCGACGDAVRHLAKEYRAKLVRLSLFPTAPGRKELRGLSPAELERIWPTGE